MENKSQNVFIVILIGIIILFAIILGLRIFLFKNMGEKKVAGEYSISNENAKNEVKTEDEELIEHTKKSEEIAKSLIQGQSRSQMFAIILAVVFALILLVPVIAAIWKIFTDDGEQGWKSIIPIYSNYKLCQIVGLPGILGVLFIVPYVGQIIMFITMILIASRLARMYGKSTAFSIGLVLIPFIFYPILAFKRDR